MYWHVLHVLTHEPLFKSLNLLKLNDITELQILSFVYQWSHRLLPPCFSENFKVTSSVHSYSTRQSWNKNLYVGSTTQYGLRSLKFIGSRLWNFLPTSITNSNSLRIFCKTLKNSMPKRQRKNLLTSVGIKPTTSGLDLPSLCRLSYKVEQRKSGTIPDFPDFLCATL